MHRIIRSSTATLTAFLLVLTVTADGCKGKSAPEATPASTAQQPAAAPAAADKISVEDLVAPIALYPDQLLGQLLLAAVNSQEVLDLGNWLIENQSIKTDAAPAAAKAAGFGTSAQYLAAFPQVVDNMCQNLDWTKALGDAFKADQKSVMDAIQRKRMQAKQQGNLQSSPQMTVDTKTDNGQQVVEIKPANPEVVYVPQYNTTTVYTQPAPAQTTVVEEKSGVSTGAAVGMSLLSFGVGMAVGAAISNNNNYYPYPAWGGGGMYYGGRPYYPPPYRPPVYAGYHPAYGYHPPGNYHWNNYNRNVNVNVNNNNYYNKYNSNTRVANNRVNNNNGYLGANNNNRPGVNNQPGNRGGSSGYLGAHPQTGQRPGASMAAANPSRPGAGGGGVRNEAVNRPNADARPGGGAGGLGASPGGGGNFGANRPNASPTGVDRGFGNNGGAGQNRAAAQNRTVAENHSGGGAFGGGNSGGADRAASNRGHASMGAQPSPHGGFGGGGGGHAGGAHAGGGRHR